ncbi:MAG TPA: hypothetical protein VM733_19490 [Thermoanaerobaculia bacterium]|nr:hypothetical protein [Thermoanaerobaculia bacterium]
MDAEWIAIVGTISSSVMVVLVVYFLTRARQRRAEVQAEVQTKLIDRFGSAPELIDFLQSPAGRQFVTGVQGVPGALARERIMTGFTRSIVLSMLGAAFLALTFFYSEDFAVPAAILFSLGIGYFLATLVSWRLSASLGGDVFRPNQTTSNS